jgi:site-specific DNA-methyltransferase (adenine-specific)
VEEAQGKRKTMTLDEISQLPEPKFTLINAEVVKWAEAYSGPLFHALLCDPPYHLDSIVKRFKKPGPNDAKVAGLTPYRRTARGFMGKEWDGGDVAFQPRTWVALARVLHPGAFGVVFAASRGWHKMALAMEGLSVFNPGDLIRQADLLQLAIDDKDWAVVKQVEIWLRNEANLRAAMQAAGFVFHPTVFLLGWMTGSGFPKATRIDTQIDRDAGAARLVDHYEQHKSLARNGRTGDMAVSFAPSDSPPIAYTSAVTPLARAWEGHRYGRQALRPAVEPIVVIQKPYAGRPVDCITTTGAGALNIAGSLVTTSGPVTSNRFDHGAKPFGGAVGQPYTVTTPREGRHPANVILAHHPECTATDCHPTCNCVALDQQGGELGTHKPGLKNPSFQPKGKYAGSGSATSIAPGDGRRPFDYPNAGVVSQWFHQVETAIEEADPLLYNPKANTRERETGLDDLPIQEGTESFDHANRENHKELGGKGRKNTHPTIKPVNLIRRLAKLLLPPETYLDEAQLLVPFAGAASEMIGSAQAGWRNITGVELTAQARLKSWRTVGVRNSPSKKKKATPPAAKDDGTQGQLF